MKNPWFTFAGICSLVLLIVLFSVVFGGYSSLIRSQSRIETMKGRLQAQCRIQLDEVQSFIKEMDSEPPAGLVDAIGQYEAILDRLEKTPSPLPLDIVSEYGKAQIRLNHTLTDVVRAMTASAGSSGNEMAGAVKRLTDVESTVFVTGKGYNKEARYFNTRTQVFPGFIIAKLFSLDSLRFHEIHLERPKHFDLEEAAGAS